MPNISRMEHVIFISHMRLVGRFFHYTHTRTNYINLEKYSMIIRSINVIPIQKLKKKRVIKGG